MEDSLKVQEVHELNVLILEFQGEITLYTVEYFLNTLKGIRENIVIIDLSEVTYIDSSGLGAIIKYERFRRDKPHIQSLICLDVPKFFAGYAHPPAVLGYIQYIFPSRTEALEQVALSNAVENCEDPERLYVIAKLLKLGPFDHRLAYDKCYKLGGPRTSSDRLDFLLELAEIKPFEEAVAIFKQGVEQFPKDFKIYRAYVDYLLKRKELTRALDVIDQVPGIVRKKFEQIRMRIRKKILFPAWKLNRIIGPDSEVKITGKESQYDARLEHLIEKQKTEVLQCISCHYTGNNFKCIVRSISGRGYVICPRCGNSRLEYIL